EQEEHGDEPEDRDEVEQRPEAAGDVLAASRSTPERIAAAIVMPRKTRARISFSFQSASAAATTAMTTSVATAARFAVSPIGVRSPGRASFACVSECVNRSTRFVVMPARGVPPVVPNPGNPCMQAAQGERIRIHERRHGIVLAGSFARAFALAGPGLFALVVGWPATVIGALLLAAAALVVLRAVW